jgi:hypothetical protein
MREPGLSSAWSGETLLFYYDRTNPVFLLRLRSLPDAPKEGAEADFRDFQAARTRCIELHGVLDNKNAILAPVMGNLKSVAESEPRSGWK